MNNNLKQLNKKIIKCRKIEEAVEAIIVLPPYLKFIIDWPIIAHPPIPPKNPVTVLAAP